MKTLSSLKDCLLRQILELANHRYQWNVGRFRLNGDWSKHETQHHDWLFVLRADPKEALLSNRDHLETANEENQTRYCVTFLDIIQSGK